MALNTKLFNAALFVITKAWKQPKCLIIEVKLWCAHTIWYMKNKLFRELRRLANEVLGEAETNKIIEDTVKEVLEETKPKKRVKKGDK